uniref:O-methyltransferase domain-containing protein n=1 Tax=Salmo trutta TaxID=8032 RepID=A0A673XUB5_SALTR
MELAAGTSNAAAAAAYMPKILDYMEVFLVSKTLFTVCEMGLFDLLASSWCPLSLEEVVQVIRASLSGTEKLYLTRSIHYSSKTIYLCWHYLIDAVREGSNQYEKAFDTHTHSSSSLPLPSLFIFSSTLSLSLSLPLRFPEVRVTIYCTTSGVRTCVCAYAETTLCYCRQPDDQLPLMDFFKDELLDADLYILARILHGWTDTRSIELLRSLQGLQTKYTHPPPSPLSPSVILSGEKDQISLLLNTHTLTHLQVHNTHTHICCITMRILFNLQLNLLLETNSKQQSGYDNCHD